MKVYVKWFVLVTSAILISAAQAGDQQWCPLCSMNLKMFLKTNQWLTFSNGERTGYCSIHCAALVYKERAADINGWQVVDYQTKTLIDSDKAYFLIGSDLPGTMTPVSKLAFAALDVAEKYQKKHGGNIGNFDEALKRALAGMGEDMGVIKKKMRQRSKMGAKLASEHGCYNCHGPGGSGGTAVAWNSAEFAQRMDSRVKIKQAILGGSHKMEGYEGKIPEKELHAVTIYIWTQRAD